MSKGEAKNHKITIDSNDVRIANDSINRAKAKPESHKRYNLINEGISQTRAGDFVSYSAMIEQSLHLLIKLINEKNIQLLSHSSLEFYEKAIINKKQSQLPFILGQAEILTIKRMRKIKFLKDFEDQKEKEITQKKALDLFYKIRPLNFSQYAKIYEYYEKGSTPIIKKIEQAQPLP